MRRVLLLIFLCCSGVLAQTATAVWNTTYQTMDGFGGQDWDFADTLSPSQAALFFSTTPGVGIGLTYVRTANTYNGSIPDLTTLQNATAIGAKIELGLQSPPCTLKWSYVQNGEGCTDPGAASGAFYDGTASSNGTCLTSNQSLATSYASWASYVVSYIQTLNAAAGANVSVLDVQNESGIATSTLGACIMPGSAYDTFISQYLGPALASAGLSVRVMMPSYENPWFDFGDLSQPCNGDSACNRYVGIFAAHTTDVHVPAGPYPDTLAGGQTLWISEADATNTPPYDASMTQALIQAQSIFNYLTIGNISGYEWWELAYPTPYNYGLTDSSFNPAKRYYAEGNWSLFVPPGSVRIGATANPQSNVYITAFKNPSTNQFTIVDINQGSSAVNQCHTLSGFPSLYEVTPWITSSSLSLAQQSAVTISAGSFCYSLPSLSVTSFVSLSGSAGNSYYISKSLGNDSNSGMSKSSPWAHLPGMASCTSTCGSFTPGPGESFILRGGDTWTNTDLGVNWAWSGTSAAPIYVGVDTTWFNSGVCGASFCRPIWNQEQSSLSGGGLAGGAIWNTGNQYVVVDNIEATGLKTSGGTGGDYFYIYGPNETYEHIYAHGWAHSASGDADTANVFHEGGGNNVAGTCIHDSVIDGSDTSEDMMATFFGNVPCAYNNIVEYVTNGFEAPGDLWYNNRVGPIVPCFVAGGCHQNAMYQFGPAYSNNPLIYNNVITGVPSAGYVKLWLSGNDPTTGTGYAFNNVLWNSTAGNYVNLAGHNASNYGTWYFFNNTLECGTDSATGSCGNDGGGTSGMTFVFNSQNNHYITSSSPAISCSYATCTSSHDLTQTVATANGQGYTSGSTYAFQPTSGSGSTVGAGVSIASLCATISGLNPQAGLACADDTGYACNYLTSNHTVSCPDRTPLSRPSTPDIGAYQYSSGGGAPVLTYSPSNIAFGNVSTGCSPSCPIQSITLNNSGTASETGLSIAMVTGTNFSETNNCPSTLAVSTSCTINVTGAPTTTGALSDAVSATGTVNATAAVSETGYNPSSIQHSFFVSHASGPGANCTIAANAETCPVTLTTAGQAIEVAISLNPGYGSNTVTGITDNAGGGSNSYTAIAGAGSSDSTLNTSLVEWLAVNTQPIASITVQFGSSFTSASQGFYGVRNISNVNAVDQVCAANNVATSTTPGGCSLTTTHANEIVFNDVAYGAQISAVASPFALDFAGYPYGAMSYDVASATGTYDASFTGTGGASNASGVSLYQAATTTATPSPTSIAFGNQPTGTTSGAQTVVLTNNGPNALTITSTASSPSQFGQTNTCSGSIAAGATCSIQVTFSPTAATSYSGTLTLTNSASNSPQTVSLSGTGTTAAPAVGLSPTSLSFGNIATGANSILPITLTNTGSASLTVGAVAASGAPFTISSQTCTGSPIAASGTCTINAKFLPTATGSFSGTVTVTDTASNSPQSVPLTGMGVIAPPTGLATAFPQTVAQ